MKRCLFLLLIFVCPVESMARDPVVKVLYFQAADVQAPGEAELQKYRQLMMDAQIYYQNQMIKQGHGPKTFSLDLTPEGDVNMGVVRGKKKVADYKTRHHLEGDIPVVDRVKIGDIDFIQVVFFAKARGFVGFAAAVFEVCAGQACRFLCVIPTQRPNVLLPLLAHELGHAFGLEHNKREAHLMHWLVNDHGFKKPPGRLDAHETKLLDRHVYFVDFPVLEVPVEVAVPADPIEVDLSVSAVGQLTTLWADLKGR